MKPFLFSCFITLFNVLCLPPPRQPLRGERTILFSLGRGGVPRTGSMDGRSRGFQDKAKASSKRLWPGQSPSDALWSYILWIT